MARRRKRKDVITKRKGRAELEKGRAAGENKKTTEEKKSPVMNRKRALLAILTAVIILMAGIAVAILSMEEEKEDWTVMVYMAGDNSLSDMVGENLDSMEEAGSTGILDVVALSDRSGSGNAALYHLGKSGWREEDLGTMHITGLNEVDTGDPRTLTRFVEYSLENHPSDNLMLIMWGHGRGWQGLASDRGGSSLSMKEFGSSLAEIEEMNGGEGLDIIGFDACAMANIEGFYEVSGYADFLVASEKKEPDAGWPYEEILRSIGKGTPNEPEDVSTMIVTRYVKAYKRGDLPDQDFTVGMTAMRTEENGELYSAFQRFSRSLNMLGPEERQVVMGIRDDLETYEDEDSPDLVHLAREISGGDVRGGNMKINVEDLLEALDGAIVKEGHWNNPSSSIRVEEGGGMGIYFPRGRADPGYSDTTLGEVTGWDEFLSG